MKIYAKYLIIKALLIVRRRILNNFSFESGVGVEIEKTGDKLILE